MKKYPFIPTIDFIPLLPVDTISDSLYVPGGGTDPWGEIDDEDDVW